MMITCPHCEAPNPPASTFCSQCGKAVPTEQPSQPRVSLDDELAASSTGQKLQLADLRKTVLGAAGALLAVAIMQALFATLIIYMLPENGTVDVTALAVELYGVAAAFFALFLLGLKFPLPASVCGFVLYIALHMVAAIQDPETLTNGLIVKIIILAVLAKAIGAGVRHRALTRQMHTA